MLQIVFKDGGSRTWKSEDFTDYDVVKNMFVVMKNAQWVGLYSMDVIKSVEFWV